MTKRFLGLSAALFILFCVPTYAGYTVTDNNATSPSSLPNIVDVFDTSLFDSPGQVPETGSETVWRGEDYGSQPTDLLAAGACTQDGSFNVRCPIGPVVVHAPNANTFVTADLYCYYCLSYYWLSQPLTFYGNAHPDTVKGGHGNDTIYGDASWDNLDGGPGNDTIYAGRALADVGDTLKGGSGNDTLSSRNGSTDSIDCGSGSADVSLADTWDTIKNCETVSRTYVRHIGGTYTGQIAYGSPGPDLFLGSSIRNYYYGLGDNDVLYGRAGADKLVGGYGKDKLYGGYGNDTLDARDHKGGDYVSCGPGTDVALVNKYDSVTGCETVKRYS